MPICVYLIHKKSNLKSESIPKIGGFLKRFRAIKQYSNLKNHLESPKNNIAVAGGYFENILWVILS